MKSQSRKSQRQGAQEQMDTFANPRGGSRAMANYRASITDTENSRVMKKKTKGGPRETNESLDYDQRDKML